MPSMEVAPGFEEKILEGAVRSPAVAMMRLSLEMDRQLRLILAVIGRLKDYTGQSPAEALDLIARTDSNAPTAELRDTIQSFWELRNRLVHGDASQEGLALRALDYGFRILRMIQAIPRPALVVFGMTLVFADRQCTHIRPDIQGVLLDAFGAKGENQGRHIHPCRKSYVAGQTVSWEWDVTGEGWGETWYRDPKSNDIKLAWSESLEFVGRPLEEI